MTQEEFDALDDTRPDTPEAVPVKPDLLTQVKAQGPVRLGALGVMLAAAGTVGAVTLFGSDPVEVSAIEALPASTTSDALPAMPSEPELVANLGPALAAAVDDIEPTQATATPDPSPAAAPVIVTEVTDCTVTTEGTALAGARIGLEINAPCDAGSRADIFQGDLQIAVALDAEGQGQIDLPALSGVATVAVVVEGRAPVSLLTEVPDMASYNRAVLHWQGDMGLELHAFEGADADYGTDGHVSPQSPQTIAHVLAGTGGHLTMLGDPTLENANMALVYSAATETGVDISIEAPVLAGNCGQEVFAGTIKITPDTSPEAQDLTLTMPGCDATGEIVMLGDLISFAAQVDLAAN